jgi:hypothetical protein
LGPNAKRTSSFLDAFWASLLFEDASYLLCNVSHSSCSTSDPSEAGESSGLSSFSFALQRVGNDFFRGWTRLLPTLADEMNFAVESNEKGKTKFNQGRLRTHKLSRKDKAMTEM